MRAAAELYAQRNKGARDQARPPRRRRQGLGRRPTRKLGRGAERHRPGGRARAARAPARGIELIGAPGASAASATSAPPSAAAINDQRRRLGRRSRTRSRDPPTCGTARASNDLVKLGELLREHGFAVGENAEMGDNPAPGVHSDDRLPLPVPQLRGARRQRRHRRRPRSRSIDGIVGDVQKLGFRTIWQAPGHFDHIHIDLANSGRDRRRRRRPAARSARSRRPALEVKLIDWDAAYTAVRRLRRPRLRRLLRRPARPGRGAHASATCSTATNASPKIRLAAFETAIVESGVHNLNYGDRDSLGVFQQRPRRAGASATRSWTPPARPASSSAGRRSTAPNRRPQRRPARAVRCRSPASRCATTRSRSRR